MKLDIVSDLHFEFFRSPSFAEYLPEHPSDTLLIAGDLVSGLPRIKQTLPEKFMTIWESFLASITDAYKDVYLVLGNHDYWGCDFVTAPTLAKARFKDTNVHVLQNDVVELNENTLLFGATMWTAITDPVNEGRAQWSMNDYRYTSYRNRNLLVKDTTADCVESFGNLADVVSKNSTKNIVVLTHHAPSERSHNKERYGDSLKFAYCNNFDHYIEEHPNIKLWVHGHDHDCHDYMIGNTRVFANAFGYHEEGDGADGFKVATVEI